MSQDKNEYLEATERQKLKKIPTHLEGLDDVLHGGIPAGRMTIINGGPGAGKTVLGLEIIEKGIKSGKPAVYISFEESKESILQNAQSMGWNLAEYVESSKLALVNPEIDYEAVLAGDFSVNGLCAILEGQAKQIGAKIIVIDAIDMLLRFFDDPAHARNQVIILNRWLRNLGLTTVMTVKSTRDSNDELAYIEFMADCVIRLDQRIQDQVTTRRLYVKKYRGSDFSTREHPFIISEEGIVVMPLSSVEMVQPRIGELVSTDDENLDKILGGGYREGSSILISGPTGSGKTSFAFTIATAAVNQNERILYISLEQSSLALSSEMQKIGLNLKPLIDSGNLKILSIIPESMGMEEHLYKIIKELDSYKPSMVVLDAISSTIRMGSSQGAQEFLIRLYHAAKKRGITSVSTSQSRSILKDDIILSDHGISFLIDTAIVLNYSREQDHMNRKILVLKSRNTAHSNYYHNFRITNTGISIDIPK